jgi:hypothetical protein
VARRLLRDGRHWWRRGKSGIAIDKEMVMVGVQLATECVQRDLR